MCIKSYWDITFKNETVTLRVGRFLFLCVLCVLSGLRYRQLTAKGAKTAKQGLIMLCNYASINMTISC